jgi:hypothetical protein
MAARHPDVVAGEPCNRQLPPSRSTQRQRGAIDVGLGAGPHATEGPGEGSAKSAEPSCKRCVIGGSPARGSLTCNDVKILRARWAERAALQDLQRTTSRPAGGPPRATSLTWSAVRSAEGWAGRPCQPGHQSPTMARWSATARRRRSRSLASLWRSGRRARLAVSAWRWQSRHLGLPRMGRLHPRQGRSRVGSSWLALAALA